VGAGEAVELTIDELNEYNWESHTVNGPDITLVAGTATYNLPTPFKAESSLRLVGNPRPLKFVRKQDYDNQVWDQRAGGTPVAYSMWSAIPTGKLTIIPTPVAADTVTFSYYRPITTPSSLTDTLDVMPWMLRAVILKAQLLVATWRGGLDGAQMQILMAQSTSALQGAISADRNPPTEDPRFQAGVEWRTTNYPVDHAYNYIDGGWD
jgi:hypothetical protein